jgi:hypothetical protein
MKDKKKLFEEKILNSCATRRAKDCHVDHECCQIARSEDNVSVDNQMLVCFPLIINLILTRVNLS